VLHRVAQGLRTHFLDPEVVALVRIVIGRSVEDVDFARSFFDRTAKRDHASLKTLFEYWQDLGIPMTGTPDMLSDMFLDLFFSDVHADAISHGAGLDHSPERLRARIDFFIRGAGLETEQARQACSPQTG